VRLKKVEAAGAPIMRKWLDEALKKPVRFWVVENRKEHEKLVRKDV
jgi:hypothetical protein